MKKKILYGLLVVFLIIISPLVIYFKSDIPVEDLKAKYTNSESEFIEIENTQVHYRDEGKGKVLVLLHGTGASLHTWDIWTKKLQDKFRIIRLDLPAFGLTGSHPKRDYSMKSYTKFLHQFLQKLNIKQCFMAGNSLGGRIAWEYTLAYPDEVQKLILLDSSGYPSDKASPFAFRLARTPVANQILRYVTPKFMFRNNLKEVYADDDKVSEKLIQRYYDLMLRDDNRQAFIDRAKTNFKDNSKNIKKIKARTLILWGDKDTWAEVKHAYKFKKDIKNSKLIMYKNVGHVPMEEIPQKSVKDAKNFLLE